MNAVVCGAQKFVCTTIQPTELPYGILYDWHGAADFVADYLNFLPLEPPHELVSCYLLIVLYANRQTLEWFCIILNCSPLDLKPKYDYEMSSMILDSCSIWLLHLREANQKAVLFPFVFEYVTAQHHYLFCQNADSNSVNIMCRLLYSVPKMLLQLPIHQ